MGFVKLVRGTIVFIFFIANNSFALHHKYPGYRARGGYQGYMTNVLKGLERAPKGASVDYCENCISHEEESNKIADFFQNIFNGGGKKKDLNRYLPNQLTDEQKQEIASAGFIMDRLKKAAKANENAPFICAEEDDNMGCPGADVSCAVQVSKSLDDAGLIGPGGNGKIQKGEASVRGLVASLEKAGWKQCPVGKWPGGAIVYSNNKVNPRDRKSHIGIVVGNSGNKYKVLNNNSRTGAPIFTADHLTPGEDFAEHCLYYPDKRNNMI